MLRLASALCLAALCAQGAEGFAAGPSSRLLASRGLLQGARQQGAVAEVALRRARDGLWLRPAGIAHTEGAARPGRAGAGLCGVMREGGAVLTETERGKDNPAPDAFFYDYPRLCYHADAEFHAQLTELYAEHLPHGDEARALDMMSSWVSHYPADRVWGRVDGLGLNREELSQNPMLTFYEVRDLNAEPSLPYEDGVFDAVTCALSVQYLQQPEVVFKDVARVLKPGGVAVFSFSNRMFPSKATYAWKGRSEGARVELVADLFKSTGAFEEPVMVNRATPLHTLSYLSASLLGVKLTGDPFYAVVARKKA